MTGEEIKAMRRALDLSARELGEALDVEQRVVLAWEREELFPTKRHVSAMRALLEEAGADMPASGDAVPELFAALADPGVWRLFRKIVAHPELRAEVERLAAKYRDPAG